MIQDEMTFFLAFAAVFLGITWYLAHLERKAGRLEERVASLEATTSSMSDHEETEE